MFKELFGLEQYFDKTINDLVKYHPFILIVVSFIILPVFFIIVACLGLEVLSLFFK